VDVAARLAALRDLDPETLSEAELRAAFPRLLAVCEEIAGSVAQLDAQVAQLQRELDRLKGEQGRPPRPPGKSGSPPIIRPVPDHSSEAERRARKPWKKSTKLDRIALDRTETLPLPPGGLPPDAQFKGYEAVVVQDLVLRTDNVQFRKAKFYSPTTGKTYLAPLPAGYQGEFGPGVKTLALALTYGAHLSLPHLHAFFRQAGLVISRGQVARLVTVGQDAFHAEQAAALEAGLRSSPWQHFDTTSTRVDGQPHACHVLGNPLFTHYHTTEKQDRATVVDVLRGGAAPHYRLDATTLALLGETSLGARVQARLARLAADPGTPTAWDAAAFSHFLDTRFPQLGSPSRKLITDAAAIAAYQADPDWPVVACLVCDDAAQFRGVTADLALCWIHDARHYKKLNPLFACHCRALTRFQERYWRFYRELLAYREAPSPAEATRLEAAFDTLFTTETYYADLATCIARTRGNKEKLLLVLTHPELPLHNNPAELAARRRVRKRDVSFGPRSEAGRQAWDTFQSLAATTAQLGISFYEYLRDRLTGAGEIPPLAEVIADRTRPLNLGWSWDTS